MKRILVASLSLVLLTGCPPPPSSPTQSSSSQSIKKPEAEPLDCVALINSATKIEVKELSLTLGKDYKILADGVKVATVSGKDIKFLSGDVFTLKDINNKILASEKEEKGLFKLNRSAVLYDGNNKITGYIGEDRLSNLFSFSYVFYFYDADKKVIGKSSKFTNSSLGSHKINNADGTEAYDVDKKTVFIGGDHYVITVKDQNSPVSKYSAILLVCMEDAIGDAQEAKENDD